MTKQQVIEQALWAWNIPDDVAVEECVAYGMVRIRAVSSGHTALVRLMDSVPDGRPAWDGATMILADGGCVEVVAFVGSVVRKWAR